MESHSDPAGGGVDWESRYLAGDTPWDKGRAHPVLDGWLAEHPVSGRILVPGCGAGHDVRVLAARPHACVVGLDLAPSAIRLARRHEPAGTEEYVEGDFLGGRGPVGFDWIFEHTCFCAIDPGMRAAYVSACVRALLPGGQILGVFYLDPDHDEGPPFGVTIEELEGLFGPAFEFVERRQGIETYDGREGREMLAVLRKR